MKPFLLRVMPILVWSVAISAGAGETPRQSFVSTATGNGNFSAWPAATPGTAGTEAADSVCRNEALAAGYSGWSEFIAWVDDEDNDAWCRIKGLSGKQSDSCGVADLEPMAGPWVRADGAPFAAELTEMFGAGGAIYHPLLLQADGSTVAAANVWTGASGLHCDSWTVGHSSVQGRRGSSRYTTQAWYNAGLTTCNGTGALICMQTGTGPALELPPPEGALAFLTSVSGLGNLASWPDADGAEGLAAADNVCRARATAAQLPQTAYFRAWLGQSGQSTDQRFSYQGPWWRPDGILFAASLNELVTSGPQAPRTSLNQNELGVYLGNVSAWTGTLISGQPVLNCPDWTSGTGPEPQGLAGRVVAVGDQWTESSSFSCGASFRLYCLADPPPPNFEVTVTHGGDDGDLKTCTLRQAIDSINQAIEQGSCELSETQETASLVVIPASVPSPIALSDVADNHLLVSRPMVISGAGAGLTRIERPLDASASYRIFSASADLTLTDMTVAGGKVVAALASGGCIRSTLRLELERVVVSDCEIVGQPAAGAGVYSLGTLRITDSQITGNSLSIAASIALGGGVYHLGGSVEVNSSTIAGNQAITGGGIWVAESQVSIVNSTLHGSNARFGGGLHLIDASALVFNSSIHANNATDHAGGVRLQSGSQLQLVSSLLHGNTGPGDDLVIDDLESTVTGSQNIVGASDADLPPDTLACDPNLGPLTYNGGPTPTLAIPVDSCAREQGSNPLSLAHDQRGDGFPRTSGSATDIGAFEFQVLPDMLFRSRFEPDPQSRWPQ